MGLNFSPAPISAEADLLLSCTNAVISPPHIQGTVRQGLDWGHVLKLAQANTVTPHLYQSLDRLSGGQIPEPIFKELKQRTYDNGLRNLFLTGELMDILRILQSNHIDVLPYKGPALAHVLYGDISHREFYDLDILVRKKDAARALEVLLGKGYRHWLTLTPNRLKAVLRSQCHYQLIQPDRDISVELHWDIVPPHFPLQFETDELFDRAVEMPFFGDTVLVPSPEDLLFVLCVHGGKDYWERLGWIVDIERLVRKYPELDWQRVFDQAKSAGFKRGLLLGLYLAHHLIGLTLPEKVLGLIRKEEKVLRRISEHVRKQIFRGVDYRHHLVRSLGFHLLIRERLRDRIVYCFRWLGVAATPTEYEWKAVPLPDSLFFLYYGMRPVRLAFKYFLKLINSVLVILTRSPLSE